MHRKSMLAIAAGVLVLAGSVVVAMLVDTDPTDNVTVIGSGTKTLPSARFAHGALRNNTDRTYDSVQVELELLDSAGAVIARAAASTANLPGQESWNFEIPMSPPSVTRFRIVRIICRMNGSARNHCALARPVEGG